MHRTLQASYHQGNGRFHSNSQGKQCLPNSMFAILHKFCKPVNTWHANDLHYIMDLGDALYLEMHSTNKETLMHPDDLPKYIQHNNSIYSITLRKPYYDDILQRMNALYPDIKTALQLSLNRHCGILLCMSVYVISIFKYMQTYFVFDSHSRNKEGMPHPNGTCIAIEIQTFEGLIDYILKLAHCIKPPYEVCVGFELTPIDITTIGKRPLQNAVRNNNKKAALTILKSLLVHKTQVTLHTSINTIITSTKKLKMIDSKTSGGNINDVHLSPTTISLVQTDQLPEENTCSQLFRKKNTKKEMYYY